MANQGRLHGTRFMVVALHFTAECNLNCPFCYRERGDGKNEKAFSFFIDMVKYIKEIAPQIALGGGEPLLFPGFIRNIGEECAKHGVILNVTTNGTLVPGMSMDALQETFEHVTMASISFDRCKWQSTEKYIDVARRLKEALPSILVGTNLLVDADVLGVNGARMFYTVRQLLANGIDRVFALHPKNFSTGVDITKYRDLYRAMASVFARGNGEDRFFVDDLTSEVFDQGYSNWKKPCHHGKDIISIDEKGGVHGCSFEKNSLLEMRDPIDVLKAGEIDIEERFACPFLVGPTTRGFVTIPAPAGKPSP